MITKIVIFTKHTALNSVNSSFADRDDVRSLTKTNQILKFNEADQSFKTIGRMDEEGLYLVYDAIDKEKLKSLLDPAAKENVLILKHSKPSFDLHEFSAVVEEGRHAPTGKFYPETVKILTDPDPEKIERILETIFPFNPQETKLELLHRCSTREGAKQILSDLEDGILSEDLASLITQEAIKKIIVALEILPDINGKPAEFESDYVQLLGELRDLSNR